MAISSTSGRMTRPLVGRWSRHARLGGSRLLGVVGKLFAVASLSGWGRHQSFHAVDYFKGPRYPLDEDIQLLLVRPSLLTR